VVARGSALGLWIHGIQDMLLCAHTAGQGGSFADGADSTLKGMLAGFCSRRCAWHYKPAGGWWGRWTDPGLGGSVDDMSCVEALRRGRPTVFLGSASDRQAVSQSRELVARGVETAIEGFQTSRDFV